MATPTETTFLSHHGAYLNAAFGGGPQGETQNDLPLGLLSARAETAGPDETFRVEVIGAQQIALRSYHAFYVCAEEGGGRELLANREYDTPGPWEIFTYTVIDDAGGAVALQASNGRYVTAELDGSVLANREALGPWETWIVSVPWWRSESGGDTDRISNRTPAGQTWLEGLTCCDEAGRYLAWGPSFFWAVRAFRDYRDRYDANMTWAAAAGATYYRGFATVGGWPDPDGWRDAGCDWSWAKDVLPQLLDDAFTRYRLRCSLTLFDGEVQFPSDSAQDSYVQEVCAVLKPRLQTIQDVQIANEYGPCGWDYDQGIARLRRHAQAVRQALGPDVPIAISSRNTAMNSDAPVDEIYAECHRLYDGLLEGVVTMTVNHDCRDISKVCGPWRPVRQSWERVVHDPGGVPLEPDASCNDEPIGPCSSVAAEEDVSRIVDNCLTTWISGRGQFTYHTDAGIWSNLLNPPQGGMGEYELIEHHTASPAVAQTLRTLLPLLPADLPNWKRTRHGLSEHPFAASFEEGTTPSGGVGFTQIWPDGITPDQGVVRFYLAFDGYGGSFVGTLMGIKNYIDLYWTDPLEFSLYSCATGELIQAITTDGLGGQTVPETWGTDILVIGRWR